jgi:hypothetical protein
MLLLEIQDGTTGRLRRGNLQRFADRLDPATSAVFVDEGVQFL